MENEMKIYDKYSSDVLEGRQVACHYVRKACERYERLKRDARYDFRPDEVDRCIKFCHLFHHYEGPLAGKRFELLPFQQFIIANLIGFYHHGENRRLFTTAYIQMARKNGKSFFISTLMLYYLSADVCERGAKQVYCAANSRAQAGLLFRMAQNLAKQIDNKGKYYQAYRNEIRFPKTDSYFRTCSADASNQDGKNPYAVVIDEYHEAKTTELYDVLHSGQQARLSPIQIVITTAGRDKGSPCYEMYRHCCDVLNEIAEEESRFAIIYQLDEGDDYKDEKNWIKANPCLGHSVRREGLATRVNEASTMTSQYVDVMIKNMNMWTDSATAWLSSDDVERSIEHVVWSDFNSNVYVGVDLASVQDMTAVSFMQQNEDGKFIFRTEYFLPRQAFEKENKTLYREAFRLGNLHITEGRVTDYDYIREFIKAKAQNMCLQVIAYDPFNASQFVLDCQADGLPMGQYSQSIGNFSRPTKYYEMLMLSDRIRVNDNPLDLFCIRNVSIKTDANGNVKPVKPSDNHPQKIDGVIAMLMALGAWMATDSFTGNII